MPGNNFLADNPKSKTNEESNEPKITWTEPVLSEQNQTVKSTDGFFDLLKNTDDKKTGENGISEFEKNKKNLHEYNNIVKEEKNNKNIPENKSEKKLKNIDRPWTLKTNLIKEEVTTFVNWQKNIIFSLLGLIFVVAIIGGGYSYLVFKEYKTVKEEKILSTEIAELENKISQAKKLSEEADDFQKKLILISKLLDNHIYWSEFFNFLENNTLANTFYTGNFSGNIKSNFTFSVTTNSYQDIDNQLSVFRANKLVLDAKVTSASYDDAKESKDGGGKIKYDLELSLSPNIFNKK